MQLRDKIAPKCYLFGEKIRFQFQLSQQRDLVEKITTENVEQLEKQRHLVEEYCSAHEKEKVQQISTNKVGKYEYLAAR